MKHTFFALLASLTLLLPLCLTTALAVEDPEIAAVSALLVDAKTDTVLYDKDIYSHQAPASLSKIMTGLLVMEAIDEGSLSLDQVITVDATAMTGLSGVPSYANIRTGEELTIEQLLQCMLVVSADEASHILAQAVCPTRDEFITLMNQRAVELGCENTMFTNPSGLHASEQYSCAWDLYLIAKEAMTHDLFQEICDTPNLTIPATNLSSERVLYTTNSLLSQFRLLGYVNTEANGVQSGYNDAAGYCLLTSAERDEMSVFSVVLGAQRVLLDTGSYQTQSYSETTRLLNWGFDSFGYDVILETTEVLGELPVTLSTEMNYVTVQPSQSITILLDNDIVAEEMERNVTFYYDSVEAPVSQGDVLGEVSVTYQGETYGTAPLIARHGVSISQRLVYQRDALELLSQQWVHMAALGVVLLIVALFILKFFLGKRRYRYGKSVSRGSRSYRGRRK